jgi:hypothetical protein
MEPEHKTAESLPPARLAAAALAVNAVLPSEGVLEFQLFRLREAAVSGRNGERLGGVCTGGCPQSSELPVELPVAPDSLAPVRSTGTAGFSTRPSSVPTTAASQFRDARCVLLGQGVCVVCGLWRVHWWLCVVCVTSIAAEQPELQVQCPLPTAHCVLLPLLRSFPTFISVPLPPGRGDTCQRLS